MQRRRWPPAPCRADAVRTCHVVAERASERDGENLCAPTDNLTQSAIKEAYYASGCFMLIIVHIFSLATLRANGVNSQQYAGNLSSRTSDVFASMLGMRIRR